MNHDALLDPVRAALDAAAWPLHVFLRDDDAGWDDERLLALLDVTRRAEVPIDVAAIPRAVGETLAHELNRRIDDAPMLLAVHQHGLAHVDHEPQGRACEFGQARDADRQRLDLLRGRVLLRRRFGARLAGHFTPPWNRCAPWTPALLAELGYRALSRSRGAGLQRALPELDVDVDWTREWRSGGPPALADRLHRRVLENMAAREPLGLMLHHATMHAEELALLATWLQALARHPRLRFRLMADLLPKAAADARGAKGV